MSEQPPITADGSVAAYVRRSRRQANLRHLWWAAAYASLGVGAAASLAAAAFVLAGTGVPGWLYFAAAAVFALTAAVLWRLRRGTDAAIAQLIDDRLSLEDGVRSAVAFEARSRLGGFETLQVRWARQRLAAAHSAPLVGRPDTRLILGAIAVPLVAMLLGLAPESQEVRDARQQRVLTAALAKDLNEGIERLVEEEIEHADDEEVDALDPDALRHMVDKLEISPEKADLLRQYAEMEQQLASKASDLKSPGLEQLLDEAASQLASAPETTNLADALAQRRLDDAADELEAFKLSEGASAEKLDQKREEIERLQTLAKRLAEAARKHEAAKAAARQSDAAPTDANTNRTATAQASSSNRPSASSRTGEPNSATSTADASEAAESDDADQLAEDIRELEEALEEAEQSLGECQGGQCTQSDLDKLASSSSRANKSLSKMGQKMRTSASRRSAQSSLRSLQQALSQCQSAVAGQCESPFAGGQQAGRGSVDSEREGVERNDGLAAEVTAATKGAGPAITTVEEAESGDGASATRGAATAQEYTRQLESFVDRPDVPDAVKEGVKLYLENIHRTPAQSEAEGSVDD